VAKYQQQLLKQSNLKLTKRNKDLSSARQSKVKQLTEVNLNLVGTCSTDTCTHTV